MRGGGRRGVVVMVGREEGAVTVRREVQQVGEEGIRRARRSWVDSWANVRRVRLLVTWECCKRFRE